MQNPNNVIGVSHLLCVSQTLLIYSLKQTIQKMHSSLSNGDVHVVTDYLIILWILDGFVKRMQSRQHNGHFVRPFIIILFINHPFEYHPTNITSEAAELSTRRSFLGHNFMHPLRESAQLLLSSHSLIRL